MNTALDTPVIFLIFNRPEETAKVFEQIALQRPEKLFIVADGPRSAEEATSCLAARTVVEKIDWECEVHRRYADQNLGCALSVSQGISWALECVDTAIILEDDCLPSADFFRFCREMLQRYSAERRIGMISGVNFGAGPTDPSLSYYFSRYHNIWGWATWRDRWVHYDHQMSDWPVLRGKGWPAHHFGGYWKGEFWKKLLDDAYTGRLDAWGTRWLFTLWRHDLWSVVPGVNLIENIGFQPTATHTRKPPAWQIRSHEKLTWPLRHPARIELDREADRRSEKLIIGLPAVRVLRGYLSRCVRATMGMLKIPTRA